MTRDAARSAQWVSSCCSIGFIVLRFTFYVLLYFMANSNLFKYWLACFSCAKEGELGGYS